MKTASPELNSRGESGIGFRVGWGQSLEFGVVLSLGQLAVSVQEFRLGMRC